MSDLPAKPPLTTPETQRFWDATAEGRLELARCDACGFMPYYPRAICPDCQSTSFTWETLSGSGRVYTFTVMRAGVSRRWRDHLPYVVAYVELDEGPRVLANVVDCDPADVAVDMAVSATFDDTGEGTSLLRFRPA